MSSYRINLVLNTTIILSWIMVFFATIPLLSLWKIEIVHQNFREGIYFWFEGALNVLTVMFFSLNLSFKFIFTIFVKLFIPRVIQWLSFFLGLIQKYIKLLLINLITYLVNFWMEWAPFHFWSNSYIPCSFLFLSLFFCNLLKKFANRLISKVRLKLHPIIAWT